MASASTGIALTRREREVAALVAEGLTDQEIADRLFLSRRTAEGHVQAIRNKLGLDNRSQVAAWYVRNAVGGAEAPTPAPAEAPRRLPVHLTTFFGRERELTGIRQALRRARGVTITGPGGAGKTRLATRVAEDLASHHPGGTWFVDLAPVAEPDRVLPAIAGALGVREPQGGDVLDAVAACLRGPAALVVLDNCEHLVEAAASAAGELLRACGALTLVCTSREPLLFDGEMVWKLPPLALPEGEPTAAAVARAEAAQLLCDRAALSDPDFRLTDANAAGVAELCRRLDGIPLALELAAAQVGALGLDGVLARLGERLDFLHRRAAPARHQTMTAAMRWSYDLLDEPQRTLFRRLAVFRGSFSEAAARAVCGEVADRLPALAAKSLLAPAGLGRWAMLETIRAFADEMLVQADEAPAAREALLRHLVEFTEAAGERVDSDQAAWLATLETEHDNLRAALASGGDVDPEATLQLAVRVSRFWQLRGHLAEGRAQIEAALGRAAAGSPLRAQALNALAAIGWRQGDYAEARRWLEESLPALRAIGDKGRVQTCLANLGVLAAGQGDFADARRYYLESLEEARAAGDRWAVAVLESNLGLAAAELGEHAEARALLEASLAALRELDDGAATGSTLVNLGLVAILAGRPIDAPVHFAAALDLLAGVGDVPDLAACLEGLAWVAAAEGDPERALRLAGAAASIRERIGAAASPAAQARLERWLPEARAALSENAETAWAAGQALSPAEAMELGRLPAGGPAPAPAR